MVKFMKKMKQYSILALVSILLLGTTINTKTNGSNEIVSEPMSSDTTTPITEFVDYGNGTTQMIIDYQNGTKDIITETLVMTRQEYSLISDTQTQPLSADAPTSTEECTDWIQTSTDAIFEQVVKLGFSWTLACERWDFVDLEVFLVGHCYAGIDINIGFGLRLPVRIILEYPEQMTVGKDYECFATLIPLNLDGYKEFYCAFSIFAYIDIAFLIFTGYWSWGPDIDYSTDFTTPIGPDLSFPIGPIPVTLLNVIDIFRIQLDIHPFIGSNRITAQASATGDATVIGPNLITWTDQNQRIPFTVRAGDFNPNTNYATIMLSDFRYYFSVCYFELYGTVNLHQAINDAFGIGDPSIYLGTVDLSGYLTGLYLGVLADEDPTVNPLPVFVKKYSVGLYILIPSQSIIPGEYGIYEICITNFGNVADEFILSLAGLDPPWEYEFLSNNVLLSPGGHAWVDLKVKPYRHYSTAPVDYQFTVKVTSQGAASEFLDISNSKDANVKVEPFYEVDLKISPETDSVVPGETVDYSINIRNLGNVQDIFTITTSGIDPNWLWELSSESVTLDPGCEADVQLSITPDRHYSTATGDYPFDVIVSNPRTSDTETAIVNILPFHDVDLIITPVHDSTFPSGSVTYQLDVRNYGNVIDGVIIDFEFIDFNGIYRVYPTVIQESWVNMPLMISGIAPGATGTEYLTIAAPFDWAGMEDATYEFITTVNSFGDSLVTDNGNAEITFRSTLGSRVYYLNYEMELLQQSVLTSSIEPSIIESLNDHLEAAINKKEQAHQNIIDGKIGIVDNRLVTTRNIMEAFINLVEAQYGKYIPIELATFWIESVNEIILDLDDTISCVLNDPPTVTNANSGSNSYYTSNYLMILMILGSIVILVNFRKKIYLI